MVGQPHRHDSRLILLTGGVLRLKVQQQGLLCRFVMNTDMMD